jgi:hypothetical protein
MQMDMTDQERNETPVATFNHQDPYEVPLLDETPAPAETPPAEAETAAPVAENKSSVPTDAGDETIPPIIPVEMKESLTDYIDEDLAASVKTLVEKVNSLESALQQERRKAKEVIRENETSGRFSGLWDTESGKFSEVLADPSARSRVQESFAVLEAGYKASGAAVPELTDLFKRAVTSEFGTSMVEAREKQINDQVSRRQSQFVSRANSGAQASERPEDRAARAVARMMADRGIR